MQQQAVTGSSQSSELDIDLYNNNVVWSKQQERQAKNPLVDYAAHHIYQQESGHSSRQPSN